MRRQVNPNLQILELAVARLGAFANEMVFLGGCAAGLLLTDLAAPPIRVTHDVDVITEVASLGDYYRRQCGFKEDQSPDAPVCRWVAAGIVLDVIPTIPEILGFGHEWFQPALDAAVVVELPSGHCIRMVTAPYFLATKLAAFDGRGRGDYVSHDMEDIVAVLDGRSEIVDEVKRADDALRTHLAKRFAALLRDTHFVVALPGHLPSDKASQLRVPLVMERIAAIAKSG